MNKQEQTIAGILLFIIPLYIWAVDNLYSDTSAVVMLAGIIWVMCVAVVIGIIFHIVDNNDNVPF